MKKIIVLLLSLTVIVVLAFKLPAKNLVGHWTIKYRSGQATTDFKSNGTFRSVDSKGDFDISGKYKLEGDVLSITDSTCGNGYWGKYKLAFAREDSVTSVAVQDSCIGRKIVCDGATMVRQTMK